MAALPSAQLPHCTATTPPPAAKSHSATATNAGSEPGDEPASVLDGPELDWLVGLFRAAPPLGYDQSSSALSNSGATRVTGAVASHTGVAAEQNLAKGGWRGVRTHAQWGAPKRLLRTLSRIGPEKLCPVHPQRACFVHGR